MLIADMVRTKPADASWEAWPTNYIVGLGQQPTAYLARVYLGIHGSDANNPSGDPNYGEIRVTEDWIYFAADPNGETWYRVATEETYTWMLTELGDQFQTELDEALILVNTLFNRDRIKTASLTLSEPDLLQAKTDAPYMLYVNSNGFPYGISIKTLGMTLSADVAYTLNFEEWDDPADATPTTIGFLSSTAGDALYTTEKNVASYEASINKYIAYDLPDTDIDMIMLWFTFEINGEPE
jgi:hypothetical protein